jgi:hypothetical protein
MIKKLVKKISKKYHSSDENEIQFHTILGFLVLPVIVLIVLFILVMVFYHSHSIAR